MELLGKSKRKIGKVDVSIEECWGTPNVVAL